MKNKYMELAKLYFNDAHPDDVELLIKNGLVIEEFNKNEWENATAEERKNKAVSSIIKLNPKNSINQLKELVEISSGKCYHLWNDEATDFYNIYKGYETSEYDKYQVAKKSIKAKMGIR